MAALADLLDPAARQRLAQFVDAVDMEHLARIASDTARESSGTGRTAWLCVAVALGTSEDITEARDALTAILGPGKLRTTALACLVALCRDDTTPETTP
jgi:hypothetical protein